VDHVVLRLGPRAYLAADGLHTSEGLLRKMREVERVPGRLALGTFRPGADTDILYDERTVERLAEHLRR
jgi:hypothetical protein